MKAAASSMTHRPLARDLHFGICKRGSPLPAVAELSMPGYDAHLEGRA